MRSKDETPAGFVFQMTEAAPGVVLLEWSGHMDLAGLKKHCTEVDDFVRDRVGFALVIDATAMVGCDPDVHSFAREWARNETATRVRAVAIVADSQLAAVESPAAALSPPRKARLFGSRRAATAFAESQAFPSSGEYPVIVGRTAARAAGDE